MLSAIRVFCFSLAAVLKYHHDNLLTHFLFLEYIFFEVNEWEKMEMHDNIKAENSVIFFFLRLLY